MIKTYPKIIVANWKSNPDSLFEAKKIFDTVKKIKVNYKKVLPIICPPVIFLENLTKKYRGNLKIGSQNISYMDSSELTGEISGKMLNDMRVKYVIVGHSERRMMGESNIFISQKILNALKNKITPILCVGENVRDNGGEFLRFLEKQIIESLTNISKENIKNIVIAYEPVWAIGEKGHTMDVHDLNQTILFIKKVLVEKYDRKTGLAIKILYGGSVYDENISEILSADVNGVILGRASINPSVFNNILKKI